MRLPVRSAVLGVVPLALVATGLLGSAALASTPTTVSGVVRNASDQAVAGITVLAFNEDTGDFVQLVSTKDDGSYGLRRYGDFSAGTWDFVYADGSDRYVEQEAEVQLAAGQVNELPDVTLVRGGTVTGTVTAPSGTVLKNVTVQLQDPADEGDEGDGDESNSGIGVDYTASDGTYTVGALPEGSLPIYLGAGGPSLVNSGKTADIAAPTADAGDDEVVDLTNVKVTPSDSFSVTSPSKGKATLKVSVSAATFGIADPGGKVTVYDGTKSVKANVTLVKGKATITVSSLKKGKHTFKVKYLGATDTKAVTSASHSVTVK